MNKYNQLREEIIKAVPEILDLVFGCKVASENGYFTIGGEAEIDIVYKGTPHERIYLVTYGQRTDDFKIIGRDITLEDCMIAMDNSGHNTQYNGIRNDGHFLIDFGDKTAWTDNDKPIKWIMNKPIQDQSDECKELLWDLICKK